MNFRRLEITLVFLIALHSTILGVGMLFQPARTLQLFGWNYQGPMFFPSQAGIFLLLFAGIYFAAIYHRKLTIIIIASKTAAVFFLLTQYAILGANAPSTILAAALLDGLMGAATATFFFRKSAKAPNPHLN